MLRQNQTCDHCKRPQTLLYICIVIIHMYSNHSNSSLVSSPHRPHSALDHFAGRGHVRQSRGLGAVFVQIA